MRKRTKVICMALAALFAFSAIAASAQAADQWYTSATQGGTYTTLPVGTNVAISGTSGKSFLKVPGAGFTITCEKDTFTGTIQNATTPVEAHITTPGLTFTECMLKEAPLCQVNSVGQPVGTIKTVAITGKTNTSTGARKAHAIFSPASGTAFVEINIGGAECAIEQEAPVKVTGAAEGVLSPEGEVGSQTATLTFPSTALSGSTLKYGTNSATFESTETATVSGTWIKLHE